MDWENQAEQDGKRWFKRREFGWGWTPVAWQGWLIVVAPLLLVLAIVTRVIAASL